MAMSNTVSSDSPHPVSWYSKCYSYIKNRNRISPGQIVIPNSEFLQTGPRRHLRILRPPLQDSIFYEIPNPNRPQSVNDNFFTRWSRRPHPSGNCRCSCRRSKRLSTTEKQLISNEIQRIRTSLCEAEKSGQDIDKIEESVLMNLESLRVTSPEIGNDIDDEEKMKAKIVNDLDKYINDLLEEIFCDTVQVLSEMDFFTNLNSRSCSKSDKAVQVDEPKGYVNEGFEGSDCDPDNLNFQSRNNIRTLDLRKQPSLEQSLMAIIDSKLGKDKSLEDLNLEIAQFGEVDLAESKRSEEAINGASGLQVENKKLPGRSKLKNIGTDSLDKSRRDSDLENFTVREVNLVEIKRSGEAIIDAPSLQVEDKIFPGRSEFGKDTVDNIDTSRKGMDLELSQFEEVILIESKLPGEAVNVAPITQVEDKNSRGWSEKIINNVNIPRNEDFNENIENSFEKSRLEFSGDEDGATCTRNVAAKMNKTVSAIREKLVTSLSSKKNHHQQENKEKTNKQQVELDPIQKKVPKPSLDVKEEDKNEMVTLRRSRKPVIVFIHGFGSSAEIFEHQLRYFSSLGYPCFAPDLLGHGFSSAPNKCRDYHFDKLLRDMEIVIKHYALKPGMKCVLVGHNYGCSFATSLAAKYEKQITQLILISGGGPTPLAPPSSEGWGRCLLRATLAPLLVCGLHRDILYSARGRQHPYCGPGSKDQWPSHMKYILKGMHWPGGDYAFHRRICTPTLLVHGLRDNSVSLVQECQMERTMIKALLEAIPSAGHTPMTDCPDQLNHMIHCFIDLWKNKR